MILLHLGNFSLSGLFYFVTCKSLAGTTNHEIFIFELFLSFWVMNFALSSSFKEPGIVTEKTIMFQDVEEEKIPEFVKKNTDFY